ncbi:MOSC domain-containing protein [Fictibacillus barbaricus]|nr:MOSC N-terminal beta barrel domain-containing protein [Fictibacillus barbaricus]GGB69191.1 molybdenum cofactor biosysynthesis protein [Fictibacillus barbaricus]
MRAKVVSLWRYPVKSMMGEELNASDLTKNGLLGDRAYGVIDQATGMLANAKNPLKWPNMFQYRANFVEPPKVSHPTPPVRVTIPSGETVLSSETDINERLSKSLKREVILSSPFPNAGFEGYIPKIHELDNPGSIFTKISPKGTFFDIDTVHLITTSTIKHLGKITPGSRIEPRRFRPNIIIDVPESDGFIENSWVGKIIQIGKVKLKISNVTKRCIMTTLAQGDLPKDINVLKSIVKNNAGSIGVYGSVLVEGKIQVDDFVQILK